MNEGGHDLELHLDAVRRWEGRVHALVSWEETAARRRFAEAGPGRLAGWALGVKDIIDVQGMLTGWNADFLPPAQPTRDAAVVEQLRKQGAFVFAKTVTTTFAYLDPGPTRNPWNPDHTPGGSSSGSAAAVACGMVRLALGTQTIASVNRPASYCGVVGFKPSYQRISTEGVFPFSRSVDTVGFFTRNLADLRTAFAALLGEPPADPPSSLRLGFLEDVGTTPPEREMEEALQGAARRLQEGGCGVHWLRVPAEARQAYSLHVRLIAAEAAEAHREFFDQYGRHYPPRLAALIRQGESVRSEEIAAIHEHRRRLGEEMARLLERFDLLVLPAAPGPAPSSLESTGDPRFSLLWTYLGLPSLTLPVGLSSSGLPLGLQVVGRAGEDALVLASALLLESLLDFAATVHARGGVFPYERTDS